MRSVSPLRATPALCSGACAGDLGASVFPRAEEGPGEAGRRLTAVEQGQLDHVLEGVRATGMSPPNPSWHLGSGGFYFPFASGIRHTGYTLELPKNFFFFFFNADIWTHPQKV